MSKKAALVSQYSALVIDEAALFERVAAIIENRKRRAYAHVNHETTMMFWEIGRFINSIALDNKRAEYGKIELVAFH
jgi:hypothetical protein